MVEHLPSVYKEINSIPALKEGVEKKWKRIAMVPKFKCNKNTWYVLLTHIRLEESSTYWPLGVDWR